MLINVRIKNCYIFSDEVNFSLKADMRYKKLSSNVHSENNFNILKTAGIYGTNNSGKTCLVNCIKNIKNILLNKENNMMSNIFTDNSVCDFGITFLHEGKKYRYDLKYDVKIKEYIYEKFSQLIKTLGNKEKEEVFILRDSENKKYDGYDDLKQMLHIMSKDNILIYLINTESFEKVEEIKKILTSFANKLEVIDMNNIPIKKTMDIMKNGDKLREKIVNFVKNSDLYLDDFKYLSDDEIKIGKDISNESPAEDLLKIRESIIDQIRLTSIYKGVPVPSLIFDSTGTKKIVALASYIIESLEEGKILVIDELDSSIHFKLTRSIVAMFNNELNDNAQLIFTVHDINLMDCNRLLRKEQIWFIHKDEKSNYLYSLSDFKANEGVRDTSNIQQKYKTGLLGALPEPDLIESLLEIKRRF